MRARQWTRLLPAALAAALAACAGGSGSSGFDISPAAEKLLIGDVLDAGVCLPSGELTICPADEANPPQMGPESAAGGVQITTGLADTDSVRCAQFDAVAGCATMLLFTPSGFAPEAVFRVAVRGVRPEAPWVIGGEPLAVGTDAAPRFEAEVQIPADILVAQFAVLVFVDSPPVSAGPVETLTATRADFAFVAAEVLVAR